MIYGLYNSASGALVQDARVSTKANNLANVETPGFRKNLLTVQDRRPESEENREANNANPVLDRMNGGMFVKSTPWGRESGPIEITGRELDAAINGEGFFRVTDGQKTFLTRAGNFKRNQNNELVTMNGEFQVLSNEGDPIVLEESGSVKIGPDGTIAVGGENLAQIDLVSVENKNQLEKVGKIRFRNMAGDENLQPFSGRVQHQALEQSNVSSAKELTGMLKSQRSFEMNMKSIEMQDSTLNRAVNQVGRPPG